MATAIIIFPTVIGTDVFKKNGTASFYNPPYTPSACFGYEDIDSAYPLAAASKALWYEELVCGTLYAVKCVGAANLAPQPCKNQQTDPIVADPLDQSIIVKIVDYCAMCKSIINLSF
ncbi:hypothetical protein UlMin_004155 [Ulmus minor]